MKTISIIMLAFLALACKSSLQTAGQNKITKNPSISEDIEWCQTWVVSTNKHDLPKVLLIGDSFVGQYYQAVADQLTNKAYCSKFTTSRSIADPVFIDQLKSFLNVYQFDVVCFNNGLHGIDYSDEQYSRNIPLVYNLIKKNIIQLFN